MELSYTTKARTENSITTTELQNSIESKANGFKNRTNQDSILTQKRLDSVTKMNSEQGTRFKELTIKTKEAQTRLGAIIKKQNSKKGAGVLLLSK